MAAACLNALLADDDSFSQKAIAIMLKKIGIFPDIVNNGQEVISALERKSYSMIFMDIQMPYMDGIEATRAIRKRWPQGPKIIMITGCSPDAYKKSCLDAGASAFLSKPPKIRELINEIGRCMPNILEETKKTLGFRPHAKFEAHPLTIE
jgi:CheY-like chemotaxis protein